MEFAQASLLGRPVIFLEVDVDRVVAAPRRVHIFIPESLEVGRDAASPGGRDEQVAPVLVIERLQLRIGLSLVRIQLQLLVRREAADLFRGVSEPEVHPAEEPAVVLQEIPVKGLPSLRRRPGGVGVRQRLEILALSRWILVEAIEARGVD